MVIEESMKKKQCIHVHPSYQVSKSFICSNRSQWDCTGREHLI